MDNRNIQAASMIVSNLFREVYNSRRSGEDQHYTEDQENHIKDAMVSLRRAMPLNNDGENHEGFEGHVDMVQ